MQIVCARSKRNEKLFRFRSHLDNDDELFEIVLSIIIEVFYFPIRFELTLILNTVHRCAVTSCDVLRLNAVNVYCDYNFFFYNIAHVIC